MDGYKGEEIRRGTAAPERSSDLITRVSINVMEYGDRPGLISSSWYSMKLPCMDLSHCVPGTDVPWMLDAMWFENRGIR